MSSESVYVLNVKFGQHILTVRGDSWNEFKANADSILLDVQYVLDVTNAYDAAHALGTPTGAGAATPAPPAATPPAAPAPAPAPAVGGIEQVTDRWGNVWTYGDPTAPALPDGRGHYAKKSGKSREGKPYTGWFDPAKGPKPFAKGAVEAPTIWG